MTAEAIAIPADWPSPAPPGPVADLWGVPAYCYRAQVANPCVDCGRSMRRQTDPADGRPVHIGRDLCKRCYQRRTDAGSLDRRQRRTLPRDVVLTEWQHLAAFGCSRAEVAARLGVSDDAVRKALARQASAAPAQLDLVPAPRRNP